MNRYLADLHIHTALSPCAEPQMTPPAIVEAARAQGLALIAICDHNSAGNAAAVLEAAGGSPVVIAGMEITCAEEAHVLGLFPDPEAARRAGERVRVTLPAGEEGGAGGRGGSAPPGARARGIWGEQPLLDARGRRIGRENRLLAAASSFTLAECVDLIREHQGLAVAAHLDRPSFSVLSQLGFLPEQVRFDAVEVSAAGARAGRAAGLAGLGPPLICSSDSHFLSAIGAGGTVFTVREPTFAELALALLGREERECAIA